MKKDFLTKKEVSFYAVEAKACLEGALLMDGSKWKDALVSDAKATYIEAMGLKAFLLNCIVDWHNASEEVAKLRDDIEATAEVMKNQRVIAEAVLGTLRVQFGNLWDESEAKKNAEKKQRADERREREALLKELEELGDAVGDEAEARFTKAVEELAGQEM